MISLNDGMLLYHASYLEIKKIDLNYCKKGLDFGRGFYTTSSYRQAYNYVSQAVKKRNYQRGSETETMLVEDGVINVYRFHNNLDLFTHCFPEADIEWLHFVSGSRDNNLFPELFQRLCTADIIGGKIANDQTRRTLIDYINGAYGKPGTRRADQFALERLLPNRLKDQFCFRTEKGIKSLEFIRSERYGDVRRRINR